MDCLHAKQLLPLWIGQDLPDVLTASDVSNHLERCSECNQRRIELQMSLDVLQGVSAKTLSLDTNRQSVWPQLVSRISEWDRLKHRARFNGWIPASVMALAVALMIAVSIPSIQEEFFGGESNATMAADGFGFESGFGLDPALKFDRSPQADQEQKKTARGIPVIYMPQQ